MTREELENQRFDREFSGQPSPWALDDSDMVDRLREIVATENGARAVISHLGDWFTTMAEEYDS